MGFFDDLDRELPDPIDPDAPLDERLFAAALDRLETGWVFSALLVDADPHDRDSMAEQVELRYAGGRYLYTARLMEKKGQNTYITRNETTRKLDREGIVELLVDQRRVGRRLVEAAGGRMPGDVPRR